MSTYLPAELAVLCRTKMWITNGTLTNEGDGSTGDCFLVYARTGPNKTDVTQFVVEKDFPGFSCGQKIVDKVSSKQDRRDESLTVLRTDPYPFFVVFTAWDARLEHR